MDDVKDPEMRHRRKLSARARGWRVALISVASVFALAIVGVGIYAFSLTQRIDNVTEIERVFPDEAMRPPPVVHEKGPAPQNILLMGSDTRGSISGSLDGAGGTRSDTMMVVHIPADRKSIQVMSLMRDFWVDIPGRGKAKLNAALAYGGVPLVVQTIEGIIDSRIDHVAIVDFEGFKGITSALGGVTVNNPEAFTSTDTHHYHFDKGPIQLEGFQALAFVRERHAFFDGDYTRVRNQQLFIKSVLGQILSKQTLANPVTISNLVNAIAPFLAVDSGLNSTYALSMGFQLRDLRIDDVKFFTMPSLGTGREGSQSIVRVNWDEVPKIQAAFKNDKLDEYTPPKD